ncbi:MAG: PDZ domain-containing protein [Dehalococcoidia bacterium]|nr:PDZ domain-containing protein [Dehalococcoidia bacterium]
MPKSRVVRIGLLAALAVVAVAGVLVFRAMDGGSSASAAPGAQEQQQEKAWMGVLFARTPDGLTIAQVIADSPADKAGLTRGDVIKAVNGTAVETAQELRDQLKDKNVDDTVTLSIDRDGQTQEVSVTLEARPEPLPVANPLLPELEGIPADELFSHVQGGQFNFTDEQGNPLTVTIDVGTVASVDTGAKTLTLNLNAGGSKTYTVDDEDLGAKLSDLTEGDNVAVMRVGDDVRAVVRGVGPLLPGLGRGRGHGFGFDGGPRERFGERGGEFGGPMMPQWAPGEIPEQAPEEAPAPSSSSGTSTGL